MIDFSTARPPADLRRLVFRPDGIRVEILESDAFLFVSDTWQLEGRAVDGREAQKCATALRRVVGSGPGSHCDVVQSPSSPNTVHPFVRTGTDATSAAGGHYLVRIDDHWIFCSVQPPERGAVFDIADVESFLSGLSLAEGPRPGAEVLRAWKQYQKTRKPGTPNGKFNLFMAPAPVYLGSHSEYLSLIRSKPRQILPATAADFQRGGRRLSPEVLEFYPVEDRSSVRVDVWVNGGPVDNSPRQPVFADRLRVATDSLAVWSSEETYPLAVEPGTYDVRVTTVNRGRTETRHLLDPERFERDDLERYEIAMKRE